MLQRLRKKHPIWYSVLSEVLFLAGLLLVSFVVTFVLLFAGISPASMDEYLFSCIQELAGIGIAVFLLARTNRLTLLRRRGSGFFNGLLVGMYPLVLIGYSAFSTLMFGLPGGQMKPAWQIITFFLGMTLVGVAEELIFRAVIAETMLEHFGTSRAGVWKACLLSGVFFGAAHLSNLLSSAPLGVLMQCAFTAALGTLFAAIYFRTGNIWVTVFLHAAMDIAAMLAGGLYGTETVADSVSTYDLTMLLTVVIYLLPAAFLLRKKKLPEVQLYWGKVAGTGEHKE